MLFTTEAIAVKLPGALKAKDYQQQLQQVEVTCTHSATVLFTILHIRM